MSSEQEIRKYSRISKVTAVLMVSVAIFYDFIEFLVDWIPFLGQILAFFIDIFAIAHFVLWFMLLGVSLISPKKIVRFWLPMLIELLPIPIIDMFIMTLGIVLTIGLTWTEDKLGIDTKKLNPKNVGHGVRVAKSQLAAKIRTRK